MEHPLSDLQPVAIPDGLLIEPWSPDGDDDFRLARNASYQDYWGAAPMPADHWQNKITNQTFQPEVGFLVRDAANGAPAGVLVTVHWEADTAATGIRNAHFMVVGTVPEYRKRGVASALLGHALQAAAEQGYDDASLSVESAGRTPSIVAKAGFTPKMRYVRWALNV
ncbi:acetyltransferase (GNAT) family protein [Lentzea atacamensis]|uniref:Acetyltransferase (GNAT) family protein n=1 Tax=Lentzea atacamensis TaxID=531938 RepID=A0ABX9E6R7_9PSEU|nr:GNAT family N-acetyltransferase [Lentzea atacamensis]RAS63274.1 acetyltransferase (GNAT) family protein [Lentzea atacamensis]